MSSLEPQAGPAAARPASDAPLVSVVIPCWNGEAFVREAIDSALNQTYPHVEVIVIDDGSTDGSVDVIRSFGKRIRWERGPNRGACAARNRGLALARGDLVQFLDADDILMPEKLARMVPLALCADARTIPVCDWLTMAADGVSARMAMEARSDDPVASCLESQLQTAAPLHRRAALLAIGGFDESLRCSQERDLHLRLACNGFRFERVGEALTVARRRPRSLSADTVRVLQQRPLIYRRAFEALERGGALTPERRRAFARAVAGDARGLIRRGQAAAGRGAFALALAMDADGAYGAFHHRMLRRSARAVGPVAAERISQAGLLLGLRP